ncbi:MAG: hypothetical protein K8R58_14025 [Bacteroidales bacterium]|nr:hypothetical protein [Bacteroidales bacterium]
MKFFYKILSFLILVVLIFSSCKKIEEFPVIPHIEYVNFTKIINAQNQVYKGVLKISFTDGDGDIGLYQWDTIPPYEYNFMIDYYEKQNGIFVKIDPELPFHARIPILTPTGANKSIKGEIEDTLFLNPQSAYDTIRFEVYIIDRALHNSNVIQTPDIIVN